MPAPERPHGAEPASAAHERVVSPRTEFARLHLWQIQVVRDLFLFAIAVGVLYLGYRMRVVTVPLLLGLALAYLFDPVIRRLARVTGRGVATGVILVALYVLVGVPLVFGTGVAVVQGATFVRELRDDIPRVVESLRRLEDRLRDFKLPLFGDDSDEPEREPDADPQPEPLDAAPPPADAQPPEGDPESLPPPEAQPAEGELEAAAQATDAAARRAPSAGTPYILERIVPRDPDAIIRAVQERGLSALQTGFRVIISIAGLAFTVFFLIPFFFFFCSVGLGSLQRFGISLIPARSRDRWVRTFHKMDDVISAFVRGRITIAAILAVLFSFGWWAVGVPAPFIIGPIAGMLSVVPYLALVTWPAAIIMFWLGQAGSTTPEPAWWIVLGPTIVYWGAQFLDDYLFTPLIQGKQTGLDTPVILFAVLGAGALAGVYGVLLAIPVAACLRIIITDLVWPRYRAWVSGHVADPLPIGPARPDAGATSQTPPAGA